MTLEKTHQEGGDKPMSDRIQQSLEIHIPSRQMTTTTNALKEKFPYGNHDWFDQTVYGTRAPIGEGLAFIRLDQGLSEDQKRYLEAGKEAGLINSYSTHEVASY
jgi:hypothetical protein